MSYFRRYRCSAFTTTAVTVVPSSRALVTAAVHTSSGMRSERGIVGTLDGRVERRGASVGAVRHYRAVVHLHPSRVVPVGSGYKATRSEAREAMGIGWMRHEDIVQAIPPAYTRHIGEQLIEALRAVA